MRLRPLVFVLLAVFPLGVYAYGQGPYYSEGAYYSQGAYTTFSKNTTAVGNVSVTGAVSKGSGTFVIDHPLDPKNKLLYHSFVESPDVKNMYDGIATLDENGEATIRLPDYFLALNRDFRYLVTPVGAPMPELHLVRGVRREWFFGAPTFRISGGASNGEVSWQVTGVRKDPLILAHPIIPEVSKGPNEVVDVGECIFEPLCE